MENKTHITTTLPVELWKYINEHREPGETIADVIWGFIKIKEEQ